VIPAAPPPSLEARWYAANRAAIASIHDARRRRDAQATFERTLIRIRTADLSSQVPTGLMPAVRAELAFPGRYHLTERERPVRRTWLQLVWSWLADRWSEFVNALSKRIRVGPAGSAAIGDVILVIAVLLVAVVAGRMFVTLQIERDRRRTRIQPLERQRSAHALWLQAAEAADRGAYGAAVRTLFAATVTLLNLRGVVHDDASATVNELRQAVREHNAAVEPPFIEIARAFTSAAYAETPVDAGLWERVRASYETLLQRVNG